MSETLLTMEVDGATVSLMTPFKHREAWLHAGADAMRDWFEKSLDVKVPEVKISTGWSKRSGKAVGWCWHAECAKDGVNQIYISPEVDEPVMALAILLHELVHATDNGQSKHSGHFRRVAVGMGLEGKMTHTSPDPELTSQLQALAAELGPYPHSALTQPAGRIAKEGTRMLKLTCPQCGWSARTTKKWIEQGLPTCSCGTELELVS